MLTSALWASVEGKPFVTPARPGYGYAQALSPDHHFLAYDLQVDREEVFVGEHSAN